MKSLTPEQRHHRMRARRCPAYHDLPPEDEIVMAFGGFDFGNDVKTPPEKARCVCRGLLQVASGYSTGFSMREILTRLELAIYEKDSLYIKLTAYGRRCILSAHSLILSNSLCSFHRARQPNSLLDGASELKKIDVGVTAERVIAELAAIAFVRPMDCVGANGEIRELTDEAKVDHLSTLER